MYETQGKVQSLPGGNMFFFLWQIGIIKEELESVAEERDVCFFLLDHRLSQTSFR